MASGRLNPRRKNKERTEADISQSFFTEDKMPPTPPPTRVERQYLLHQVPRPLEFKVTPKVEEIVQGMESDEVDYWNDVFNEYLSQVAVFQEEIHELIREKDGIYLEGTLIVVAEILEILAIIRSYDKGIAVAKREIIKRRRELKREKDGLKKLEEKKLLRKRERSPIKIPSTEKALLPPIRKSDRERELADELEKRRILKLKVSIAIAGQVGVRRKSLHRRCSKSLAENEKGGNCRGFEGNINHVLPPIRHRFDDHGDLADDSPLPSGSIHTSNTELKIGKHIAEKDTSQERPPCGAHIKDSNAHLQSQTRMKSVYRRPNDTRVVQDRPVHKARQGKDPVKVAPEQLARQIKSGFKHPPEVKAIQERPPWGGRVPKKTQNKVTSDNIPGHAVVLPQIRSGYKHPTDGKVMPETTPSRGRAVPKSQIKDMVGQLSVLTSIQSRKKQPAKIKDSGERPAWGTRTKTGSVNEIRFIKLPGKFEVLPSTISMFKKKEAIERSQTDHSDSVCKSGYSVLPPVNVKNPRTRCDLSVDLNKHESSFGSAELVASLDSKERLTIKPNTCPNKDIYLSDYGNVQNKQTEEDCDIYRSTGSRVSNQDRHVTRTPPCTLDRYKEGSDELETSVDRQIKSPPTSFHSRLISSSVPNELKSQSDLIREETGSRASIEDETNYLVGKSISRPCSSETLYYNSVSQSGCGTQAPDGGTWCYSSQSETTAYTERRYQRNTQSPCDISSREASCRNMNMSDTNVSQNDRSYSRTKICSPGDGLNEILTQKSWKSSARGHESFKGSSVSLESETPFLVPSPPRKPKPIRPFTAIRRLRVYDTPVVSPVLDGITRSESLTQHISNPRSPTKENQLCQTSPPVSRLSLRSSKDSHTSL